MKDNKPSKLKHPDKQKKPVKSKRNNKGKRITRVKRPNAVLYFLTYIFVYPLYKICFKLEVDRKNLKVPKGAYIVLANHNTMLDFLFVMLSIYPHRLNAVGAHKWFLSSPLDKLLHFMGVIPKNMFDPDARSVMGIKTALNRGDGVLLFPEGRCSSSQAYVGIHKTTGKMIKKFGVPVISCYLEGMEICMPHWRKGFRFGRIRITFSNLFSGEDTETLSIDEMNAAIDARLSGDEGVSPAKKPFATCGSKRLAEGLHLILFYCPKCNKEFTMTSEGNTIRCTACGNEATLSREAKLTPAPGSIAEEEISLWYRDQVRNVMKTVSEDMEPIVESVKVRSPSQKPGGGVVDSGSGTMRIDSKGWHFNGEIYGEKVDRFFPVDTVPAMSYDHDYAYMFYYGGEFYQFIPEDPRKSIRYMILAECLHWKFASKVLMTPPKNSGFE